MRKRVGTHVLVAWLAAQAGICSLSGCASSGDTVRAAAAAPDQAQLKMEHTSVHFLTKSDLATFVQQASQKVVVDNNEVTLAGHDPASASWTKFKNRVANEQAQDEGERSALLVAGAVWAAEFLIDQVIKAIKKQQEKYTAEYVASSPGLLYDGKSDRLAFEAIVVRRDSLERAKADDPWAFKSNQSLLVFRIAEIPRSKNQTQSGLFDLTPIMLVVSDPKCETSVVGGGRITSKFRLTLEAAHAASGAAGPKTILDYSFAAAKMKLGELLATRQELGTRSSAFAVALDKKSPVAVTARLEVMEVDGGYDKKILEAIGGALENNKTKIIEIVKTEVGGK